MNQDRDPDRLLDHNYDGIQEYDNPMPRWWVWIFVATIAYSLLYMLNLVPGVGSGRGRIANFEADVRETEAKRAAARPAAPHTSEAALLALMDDPARLEEGRTVYASNCTPCHRADGGGSIGPNLTDDYWIHGGRPLDILKIVTDGVPTKGMPSWGLVLRPEQLPVVVAYVMTLHDTHPPDPKEPQGVVTETEKEQGSGNGR